jgi:Fic family protein
LTQVTVSLPPLIAARPVPIDTPLAAEMETAVAKLVALDQGYGDQLEALGLEAKALLAAHAALMADDPSEHGYAGRWRDVENWIGGSDYSPRNALYVPPPPDAVAGYVDDLLGFVHRDDLPVLAQAAVAHAQFESIHPFTDGNGRIGRALITRSCGVGA